MILLIKRFQQLLSDIKVNIHHRLAGAIDILLSVLLRSSPFRLPQILQSTYLSATVNTSHLSHFSFLIFDRHPQSPTTTSKWAEIWKCPKPQKLNRVKKNPKSSRSRHLTKCLQQVCSPCLILCRFILTNEIYV